MDRIFGLDVARATAISLVVLAHLHQGSQELGIYGVELFFALSGFLIGGILFRCVPEKGRWTWDGAVNFWQRRWWRTLPAYYLFLTVAAIHHAGRGEWPGDGWAGVLPYLVFLPNLMSPNEVFFDVSWSLCVEEIFYLLFPALVLLTHRATSSRGVAFGVSLAVFFLGSAALREIAWLDWPAAQCRVMTLPRLDAIGFGVAMAVLDHSIGFSSRTRRALAGAGIAILAVTACAHLNSRPIDHATQFFRLALVAMPLGFSLLMPLLARWRGGDAGSPICAACRRAVTSISLWSYSIYLCHHTILMAVIPWFGESHARIEGKILAKAVGLALVLILSRFIYRYFESPLTRLRPAERHAAGFSSAAPRRPRQAGAVPGSLPPGRSGGF